MIKLHLKHTSYKKHRDTNIIV